MIAAVATSSFATRWLGTWLPDGWTTQLVHRPPGRSSSSTRSCCVTVRGRVRRGVPGAADRRAGRLHAGAAQLPRQAAADAALPAAADGAADHLRHPAGDGALQGAARRHDLRRDPGQPDSGGAVRHPRHDPVHRADRPEPRVGGAGVRRRTPAACSGTSWCRCWRPGILAASLLVLVRTIAHVRADLPHRRARIRRRWSSRCTTRCSPPACARRSRSTRWR